MAANDNGDRRLHHLADMERLSEALGDRDGGELFAADLEEARTLARSDPRFEPLVDGLQAASLGDRMAAINRFFASFEPEELASLDLPANLGQLRFIYLSSR